MPSLDIAAAIPGGADVAGTSSHLPTLLAQGICLTLILDAYNLAGHQESRVVNLRLRLPGEVPLGLDHQGTYIHPVVVVCTTQEQISRQDNSLGGTSDGEFSTRQEI